MKVCYVDDSGSATDPVLVMVGIVADAARLSKTSQELTEIFERIRKVFPEELKELKGSRILYGKGGWKHVSAVERKSIFADLSSWLTDRKHDLVLGAIDTKKFASSGNVANLPTPIGKSAWVAAAFNVALQLQAKHQGELSNKGKTFLFVDDNAQHFPALCDALWEPSAWFDGYYPLAKKQERMDQIIDTAFAVRSHHCALVQVADLLAFVFRRHFELENYGSSPEWPEEAAFIKDCLSAVLPRIYRNAGAMKNTNVSASATWYRAIAPLQYDRLLKGQIQ